MSEIPTVRQMQLLMAMESISYGVTKEDLLKFFGLVKNLINKGDKYDLAGLANYYESMLQLEFTGRSFFTLAEPIILLENESDDSISNEFTEQKLHLFENNDNWKAFFLRIGHAMYESLGHGTIEDMESKLKKQFKIEKAFSLAVSKIV
jgi:hypothetical protein